MKLSIFTTVTNPLERQDPFFEAILCYLELADEVVIVIGDHCPEVPRLDASARIAPGYINELYYLLENSNPDLIKKLKLVFSEWPEDFDWPFIGQQFQRGFDACTGDWVIRCDLDYFFHENDIPAIRSILENNPNELAFSMYKWQFLLVDRYNLKSRTVLALNKGKFGKDIRLDAGGDLCQASFKGKEIMDTQVPEMRVPYWNYDFCFKTLPVIERDWIRFRSSWARHFGLNKDFGEFRQMMVGRYKGRSWQQVSDGAHPKYILNKVLSITPDQFGHSMFGWPMMKDLDQPK